MSKEDNGETKPSDKRELAKPDKKSERDLKEIVEGKRVLLEPDKSSMRVLQASYKEKGEKEERTKENSGK